MRPRALSRAAARALLLVWIAGAALPVLGVHGGALDDAACVPGVAFGDDAAVLRPASDAAAHDHCGICHLQRAARGALAVAIADARPVDLTGSLARDFDAGGQATRGLILPSRAPPARS